MLFYSPRLGATFFRMEGNKTDHQWYVWRAMSCTPLLFPPHPPPLPPRYPIFTDPPHDYGTSPPLTSYPIPFSLPFLHLPPPPTLLLLPPLLLAPLFEWSPVFFLLTRWPFPYPAYLSDPQSSILFALFCIEFLVFLFPKTLLHSSMLYFNL